MICPLLKDWQRVMLQRYDREKYVTDRALREEIHKHMVTNTSQESQFILSGLGKASPTLQHLHSNTPIKPANTDTSSDLHTGYWTK